LLLLVLYQKKPRKKGIKNYSLYREPFKVKDYDTGYKHWKYVISHFPGFRKTPFYDGIEMYKSKMENATLEQKEDLQNEVMSLYDKLAKCHGNKGEIARLKANEYLKWDKLYATNNTSVVRKYYQENLAILENDVKPTVLKYLWVQCRNDLVKKLKTQEEVVEFSERIKLIAQFNIERNRYPKAFKDLILSLNKLRTPSPPVVRKPDLDTCEGIVTYYKKFVDAQDKKQCVQARLRMEKLGCKGHFYDALLLIVPLPDNLLPQEINLFRKGIELYKEKRFDEAELKLKESLNVNTSSAFEEQINFYIANSIYAQKNYQAAAAYYEQIIASGSKYKGKSFIALGNCYLGVYKNCGTSKLEKAAVVYAAAEMYENAKIDPEQISKASQKLKTIQKYFLDKSELFMMGIKEGSTTKAGCWINKSVTVRTKKNL